MTGAANVEVAEIARKRLTLPADAMQCDVMPAVRGHEAHLRGVNHSFASELAQDKLIEPWMAARPRLRDELTRLTPPAWST